MSVVTAFLLYPHGANAASLGVTYTALDTHLFVETKLKPGSGNEPPSNVSASSAPTFQQVLEYDLVTREEQDEVSFTYDPATHKLTYEGKFLTPPQLVPVLLKRVQTWEKALIEGAYAYIAVNPPTDTTIQYNSYVYEKKHVLTPIPEPATSAMLAGGLIATVGWVRKRRGKTA